MSDRYSVRYGLQSGYLTIKHKQIQCQLLISLIMLNFNSYRKIFPKKVCDMTQRVRHITHFFLEALAYKGFRSNKKLHKLCHMTQL
jgi:hypothetical protein